MVSYQLSCLWVNLHTLLFCRLQVVPSVVRLIKQTNVFPLKTTLKKFIIWEINSDKGILKEDFQASSRVPIINKDSGGHTLATSSTKTRVSLQTSQSNKDLTYSRGLLS